MKHWSGIRKSVFLCWVLYGWPWWEHVNTLKIFFRVFLSVTQGSWIGNTGSDAAWWGKHCKTVALVLSSDSLVEMVTLWKCRRDHLHVASLWVLPNCFSSLIFFFPKILLYPSPYGKGIIANLESSKLKMEPLLWKDTFCLILQSWGSFLCFIYHVLQG